MPVCIAPSAAAPLIAGHGPIPFRRWCWLAPIRGACWQPWRRGCMAHPSCCESRGCREEGRPWAWAGTGRSLRQPHCMEARLFPFCMCREVADRLRRPTWMPEQHRLWPAAFKAAAAELLRCLHSVDRQLAGAPAGKSRAWWGWRGCSRDARRQPLAATRAPQPGGWQPGKTHPFLLPLQWPHPCSWMGRRRSRRRRRGPRQRSTRPSPLGCGSA